MIRTLLFLLFVLAGCGAQKANGECKDYRPISGFCDDDATYDCITTDDGCEFCGCFPNED